MSFVPPVGITRTGYIAGGGGSPVGGTKSADSGVIALSSGDASAAIAFNAPFSAAPSVVAQIILPDGSGSAIECAPDESTRTATGVTVRFAATIPDVGYKLAWQAVGATQGASPTAGVRMADSGVVNLSAAATSAAVSFNLGFSTKPAVSAVVAIPNSGGDAIFAIPDESTLTAGGVTFRFTAAIPAGGYVMRWTAIGS